jgi:peptidoglycan/LPS O-acetylase OafA/YrhL
LFAVIFHAHPLHTFLLGNLLNIQNYTGSSLGHTWSLAVEEHFYLLLTLLILMAVQWKWSPKSMVILFISISVVVAISRSIMQANGIVCHEYTHCQIDALFLGVILALTYNYWPDVFAAIQARKVLLWATFLICLAWLLNGSRTHMEYLTLVFTDLGCGALLLILFCPVTVPNRSWLYRLIALIGTYSYGIYLWHLSAGFYAMRAAAHLPPSVAFWYLIIAPFLAAILFGVLMTKLIEFPFLILRDKLIPPLHGSHLLPEPKTPRAPDHAW